MFLRKFIAFSIIMTFSVLGFSLEVYKESATASFYGADFHGKKTSNGETFNMNDYTCANKDLPFDTVLKVTNLENGKSVEVRVNDRGPFVVGRDVDLSTQAAIDLEMTKSGLATVKLEIVKMGPDTKLSRDTAASAKRIMAAKTPAPEATAKPAQESAPKPAETPVVSEEKLWDIQVASFSSRDNALAFARNLSKKGFKKIVLQTTKKGIVRVVVSRIPDENLKAAQNKLRAAGYKDFIVKERKN